MTVYLARGMPAEPRLSPTGCARDEGAAGPLDPDVHVVRTALGPFLLVVDGSRVYGITEDLANELERAAPGTTRRVLADAGVLRDTPYVDDATPADPPIRALSLAVAQKCNLGCTYCYAEQGTFGGEARDMSWEIAETSVLRLLDGAGAGDRVNLSFLGGEPLSNRALVQRATEMCARLASERKIRATFSITTNGTLLSEEDAAFFETYAFSVTVSLDGIGAVHDAQRPFQGGGGSYERIVRRVRPLLAMARRASVSARVTVTPDNLGLHETLDELITLGFGSVGFSPMLRSPTGRAQMGDSDLDVLLHEMIACAEIAEAKWLRGERYPFSNLESALREIHRGTHRPYPCGAGSSYHGVAADGALAACHRFVGEPAGIMGHVDAGVDRLAQRTWLANRHVHRQDPCTKCWARYLCGGGCHHEVLARGRPACAYIRGWLHHCVGAYIRIDEHRPELLQ
ncbi:MAG TPA: SPASM domain-containing protein [Polyangium sp.]|nr:SPASM domain-containing protein [Polyangium sp.]